MGGPRRAERRPADGGAGRDDRDGRFAFGPADLAFSNDSRQWVVTAYALAFGSLLLVGGKVGDLFGRKWTLIAGLVGFSAASAVGGLAQSFGVLVAARATQGVFGALLAPSALSLLTVTFAGTEDWPRAFGIFGAVAGGAGAVGLLLGGVLTQVLSWRWCFYVNLVIAVPTTIVALRLLVNHGDPNRARIDIPGVLSWSLVCLHSCSASLMPRRTGGAPRPPSSLSSPAPCC
jgi:MFS family permease